MKSCLVLLGSLFVPTIALAQPAPGDPSAPAPSQAPPPPATAAPAPPPSHTTVIINPPPPPPRVVTRDPRYPEGYDPLNASAFASGAMVFTVSYAASIITAVSTNENDEDERDLDQLYIPVAGPWLALSDRGDCNSAIGDCDHEATVKALLIADGVVQAVGVASMLYGVFRPPSRQVMVRTAKLDTKVRVRPTVVHGDPGVTVFGRF